MASNLLKEKHGKAVSFCGTVGLLPLSSLRRWQDPVARIAEICLGNRFSKNAWAATVWPHCTKPLWGKEHLFTANSIISGTLHLSQCWQIYAKYLQVQSYLQNGQTVQGEEKDVLHALILGLQNPWLLWAFLARAVQSLRLGLVRRFECCTCLLGESHDVSSCGCYKDNILRLYLSYLLIMHIVSADKRQLKQSSFLKLLDFLHC